MEMSEKIELGKMIVQTAEFFNQRITQLIENAVTEEGATMSSMFYTTDEELRDAIRAYIKKHA